MHTLLLWILSRTHLFYVFTPVLNDLLCNKKEKIFYIPSKIDNNFIKLTSQLLQSYFNQARRLPSFVLSFSYFKIGQNFKENP